MSSKLRGHDLRCMVNLDDTMMYIAMAKNCELSINPTLDDATTKDDADGAENAEHVGYGWEITTDGLVPLSAPGSSDSLNDPIDITDYAISGSAVAVKFYANGRLSYAGTAVVSSFKLGGQVNENATYNVTFKGQGTLSKESTSS